MISYYHVITTLQSSGGIHIRDIASQVSSLFKTPCSNRGRPHPLVGTVQSITLQYVRCRCATCKSMCMQLSLLVKYCFSSLVLEICYYYYLIVYTIVLLRSTFPSSVPAKINVRYITSSFKHFNITDHSELLAKPF